MIFFKYKLLGCSASVPAISDRELKFPWGAVADKRHSHLKWVPLFVLGIRVVGGLGRGAWEGSGRDGGDGGNGGRDGEGGEEGGVERRGCYEGAEREALRGKGVERRGRGREGESAKLGCD